MSCPCLNDAEKFKAKIGNLEAGIEGLGISLERKGGREK